MSELLTRHQADVEKILEHIEKEWIIPPLGIVQKIQQVYDLLRAG
jgi:hypothetical protein